MPEEDNEDRIGFVTFSYHSFCKLHKSVEGAPTKCPHCTEEDQANKKLFFRKKHITNNNETVASFFQDFFLRLLHKYRYHKQLVILLGKNFCVKMRRRAALKMRLSMLFLRDFMDALTFTLNGQFQSTHFGKNAQVNMEGIACP